MAPWFWAESRSVTYFVLEENALPVKTRGMPAMWIWLRRSDGCWQRLCQRVVGDECGPGTQEVQG